MSKTNNPPVPYAEAKRRVLFSMYVNATPKRPSEVAWCIWPRHRMKPQGAAFAASVILNKMKAEKLVRWTSNYYGSGWVLA